jgi:hypothetical protein
VEVPRPPIALAALLFTCHVLDVSREITRVVYASMQRGRLGLLALLIACLWPDLARAESSERSGSADHVPGTTISVHINAGEWIAVGTCGVTGARVGGDTVLRLRDPDGVEIAYSDDACGGLGSRISFRATRTGAHQIVLACYSSEGCGGRVAWQVDDEEVRMPFATWDLGLDLRALLGPDGQGLVADAWIRARLDGLGGMVLSLAGAPMGIAGGIDGGVLGGAVHLVAGWDIGFAEVGIGGGVSTLSRRGEGVTLREAGVLAFQLRFGRLDDFHMGGRLLLAFPTDESIDYTLDVRAVMPLEAFELVAHGLFGMSGVALGEVGFVYWPAGSARQGVGVAVLAGGSAVTYQPVCRFGLVCAETVYAGPHVGVGLHIRP